MYALQVRFMIEQRANDPEKLKEFCGLEGEWSFVREEALSDFEVEFHFHRGAPKASKDGKKREVSKVRDNNTGGSDNAKKRRNR